MSTMLFAAMQKKLLNHRKRHHLKIVFLPYVEAPSKVIGEMIPYHFLLRKLIFSASKKHALKELKYLKVHLAVVLGIAFGSIPEEKNENKKIGVPAEQRKHVFDLVESTLKFIQIFFCKDLVLNSYFSINGIKSLIRSFHQ
jgi:hypothetical protein